MDSRVHLDGLCNEVDALVIESDFVEGHASERSADGDSLGDVDPGLLVEVEAA